MEGELYTQDAYGSADALGGDVREEGEEKAGKEQEEDQDLQVQEALEEQQLEELVELVQTLTILPYKSDLRWTKHHRDLIRGFLQDTAHRLLCCYLLLSQSSSTSVSPTISDPPSTSPKASGAPRGPSSAADRPPERRLAVSYVIPTSQRIGSVWYFLRVHEDNGIENDNDCCNERTRSLGAVRLTVDNFSHYVIYGTLEVGRPEALRFFLEGPFQSLLQHLPQHMTLRNDILRTFFALGAEAVYHVGEVTGNPALFLPNETLALEDKDTKGLVQDVDLVNRVEELVLCWMDQLHTQNFRLGDATSPLEEGLLHEIRRWRNRSKSLSSVLRLVASPVVERVLTFLRSHHSPFVFLFQEAISRLQKLNTRTREFGSQFFHLEGPLERFYTDGLQFLSENIFDVLAILRIIWVYNPHHRKRSMMTEVCVRVSWEVTRACQVYLPLETLFTPPAPTTGDLSTSAASVAEGKSSSGLRRGEGEEGAQGEATSEVERSDGAEGGSGGGGRDGSEEGAAKDKGKGSTSPIEGAIRICQQWKDCYSKLSRQFLEEDYPEVWLPESPSIFLPVDLFVLRCQDLHFIWLSKTQLSRHGHGPQPLSLQEVSSSNEWQQLDRELAQVDEVLHAAVSTIARRSHLAFLLTSKDWLKHFDRYRQHVEEVERRYQCVMVAAVQKVESARQGLRVLGLFKPLAARHTLFPVFHIMIDQLLGLFEKDCEEAEREYVIRSLAVGGPGFSYAEMARWARKTRTKLETEIAPLRVQTWLPYYPRLDTVYERMSKTCRLLRSVVVDMYRQWKGTLETHPSKRLLEPLMRWVPAQKRALTHNFDRQLERHLSEAEEWRALGFAIPDSLQFICREADTYTTLRKRVTECVGKFNALVNSLSGAEAELFEGQMEKVVRTFYPGLSTISWNQKPHIGIFLERCFRVTEVAQRDVNKYHIMNTEVMTLLEEAKKVILYQKGTKELYSGDEFQKDVHKQIKEHLVMIRNSCAKIETMLKETHNKLIYKNYATSQKAWVSYIQRIDDLFIDVQKEIVRRSLLALEGVLIGSRKCPAEKLDPVFKVFVNLEVRSVTCSPSIEELLTTVGSLQNVFSEALSEIPCLLRLVGKVESTHDHFSALKDESCENAQTKVKKEFQDQLDNAHKAMKQWNQHKDLWELPKEDFFENYVAQNPSAETFQKDIESMKTKLRYMENTSDSVKVDTFLLKTSHLKTKIVSLCREWITQFEKELFKMANQQLNDLYEFIAEKLDQLEKPMHDVQSAFEQQNLCIRIQENLKSKASEFETMTEKFKVLEGSSYSISREVQSRLKELNGEWSAFERTLSKAETKIEIQLQKFQHKLALECDAIMQHMDDVRSQFAELLPVRLDIASSEAQSRIQSLRETLAETMRKLEINTQLVHLSMETLQFPDIVDYEQSLVRVERLWILQEEWRVTWSSWGGLRVEDVNVVALQDVLASFGSRVKDVVLPPDESWEIKNEMLRRVEQYKQLLPVVINLQSVALRDHHWADIKRMIKAEFDEKSDKFTLDFLLNLNLTSYEKEMQHILADASSELQVTTELYDIKNTAMKITLRMKSVHSTGSYILASTADAYSAINDLSVRLRSLAESKHAEPYMPEIDKTRRSLHSMLSFLETFEEVQRKWMRWEPFFQSQDVRNHVMYATSVFSVLDARWRRVSSQVSVENFLMAVSTNEDLLADLEDMSSHYGKLPSLIARYLEDRRQLFPRFWFLSDDDLVGVLSIGTDGERIGKFLPKMFNGVVKLKQEKNIQLMAMEIIGVYSAEGEFVELNDYVTIENLPEIWLPRTTQALANTLKENVRQCRNSMKNAGIKVDEVLKVWPLQVCIVSYNILWAADLSKSMAKLKSGANFELLKGLSKKTRDTISRITSLLQGNLNKMFRQKLRLFLLAVMQSMEQIMTIYKEKKLPNLKDYLELHFKYVWERDLDDVIVHQGMAELPYTWEYQGLEDLSVMTPSTWQTALNLTRVVAQNRTVGLVGEPCVGKSETVKMTSRGLGRLLVGVECSPVISVSQLVRLLVGACQGPSWLLLEAAHRLNPQVIPVLADILAEVQALTCLGSARSSSKRSSSKNPKLPMMLEGINVSVSPSSAVILELEMDHPNMTTTLEVLREQLRPVVVYRPDIQAIIECHLFVDNLPKPRLLAKTLWRSLSTLARSLPSSRCYNLGLRAALQIIARFRTLYKSITDIEDGDLLALAIQGFVIPQLVEDDKVVFNFVFKGMFPDLDATLPTKETLREALILEMRSRSLKVDSAYVKTIMRLDEALTNERMIVLLLGPPGSGKSTAIDLLMAAHGRLAHERQANYRTVQKQVLSPLVFGAGLGSKGATPSMAFFGEIFRDFETSEPSQEQWLVFEGPGDNEWITWLFAHIDFSRGLFVTEKADSYAIPSNLKILIVATGKTVYLTPSDLSTCSIVYFPQQQSLWQDVLEGWLDKQPDRQICNAIRTLISQHYKKLMDIAREFTPSESSIIQAKAFIAFMDTFIKEGMFKENTEMNSRTAAAFVFSCIWALGSSLQDEQLLRFTEIVREISDIFPFEGTIYDFFVCPKTGQFRKWEEQAQEFKMHKLRNVVFGTEVVPSDRILKFTYLARTLICAGIPTMLQGDAGTGKSLVISLLKQLSDPAHQVLQINFTASAQSHHICKDIEQDLERQGRRQLVAKKDKLLILIDDLQCMEDVTAFQGAFEVIKYCMSNKRIHTYRKNELMQVPDSCCLISYRPPSLASEPSSPEDINKKVVHKYVMESWYNLFHVLKFPDWKEEDFNMVFDSTFDQTLSHLEQDVRRMKMVIGEGLLFLYKKVEEICRTQGKTLVPVCHHPRLITSFLRGLQLGDEEIMDSDNFVKVFVHESFRVFHDAVCDYTHNFSKIIDDVLSEYFCVTPDFISCAEGMYYSRLLNEEKMYGEISSIHDISKDLKEFLAHDIDIKKSIGVKDLMVSNSFTCHLIKGARVLGNCSIANFDTTEGEEKFPLSLGRTIERECSLDRSSCSESVGGHLILVGPPGSGKKTNASLISYIGNYKFLEVCGASGEDTVLTERVTFQLASGGKIVFFVDWCNLEDKTNIHYVNKMILEEYYNVPEGDSRIRAIISVPKIECIQGLLDLLPAVSHSYTIDTFKDWETSELQMMVIESIKDHPDMDLSDQKIRDLAVTMSFMHNNVSASIRHSLMSSFNPSCKFLMFIKEFIVQYKALFTKVNNELNDLETNITKLEDTQRRVSELSTQLQKQRAQVNYIQQTCANTVLKMRNIKSEQGRLEQDLKKKSVMVERQKEEATRIRELINRDLAEPRQEMRGIHRRLDRISREEIEELKSLGRPPASVEMVFEAVLSILGLDPTWSMAKKQLTHGLDFILAIRRVTVEETGEKMLNHVQTYLAKEEMDQEKVEEDSPTAAVFYNWLVTFEKYSRVYRDYHPLKVQADTIEKDIAMTMESMNQYQKDLVSFGKEHQELMQLLREKEQELEGAEEEMKKLEERIQLAQKVMGQLAHDKIKWQDAVSASNVKLRNLCGDSLMVAGFYSYLGIFPYKVRREIIRAWRKKMDEISIFYSKEKTILEIVVPAERRVAWQEEGLGTDEFSIENAAFLDTSQTCHLVVDPQDLLHDWIQCRSEKDDVSYIDVHSDSFTSDVLDALTQGRTAIVMQEELNLPRIIEHVLEGDIRVSKHGEQIIRLGTKKVTYSSDFKLYIVLRDGNVSLSDRLLCLLHIVNVTCQEEGLQEVFCTQLCNHCLADNMETLRRNTKDLIEKQQQLESLQTSIGDLLSKFDDSVLEEISLMEVLQTTCAKMGDARRRCNDLKESLKLVYESLETFRPLAGLITQLFLLVEKLPKYHPDLVLSLQRFTSLALQAVEVDTDFSFASILNSNVILRILQKVYIYLSGRVNEVPQVIVGLHLGLWYEQHLDLAPASLTTLLCDAFERISDEGTEPNPFTDWLSERAWKGISVISHVSPFGSLLEDIKAQEALWARWYRGEQPETVAFPRPVERKIRGAARLVLLSRLRPDRLVRAARLYTQRILRVPTPDPASSAANLTSAAKGSSGVEPIIVTSDVPVNLDRALAYIYRICQPTAPASSPDTVTALRLGQGREKKLNICLDHCMKNGWWLLLKQCHLAPLLAEKLPRHLRQAARGDQHKNFLLWLSLKEKEPLPLSLRRMCHNVSLSLPSTVRESLKQLYTQLGETRLSTYASDTSKKCLVCLALLHLGFLERSCISGLLTPLALTLSNAHWEEAEQILNDLVTSGTLEGAAVSMTFANMIAPVYVNGALNVQGRDGLTAVVQYYLGPDMIQRLNEFVTPLTHYTVPRTTDVNDHMAQLEYIYLAHNSSLALVATSQVTIAQRHKSIELCHALAVLNKVRERQRKKREDSLLLKMEGVLYKVKAMNIEEDTPHGKLLLGERNALLSQAEEIARGQPPRTRVHQEPMIFSQDLLCRPTIDHEKNTSEANSRRLSVILETSEYLLKIKRDVELISKLRLGLLHEPLALMSHIMQTRWPHCREPTDVVEFLVVTKTRPLMPRKTTSSSSPKSLVMALGKKKLKMRDTFPEYERPLRLTHLIIVGAKWNVEEEVLTLEDVMGLDGSLETVDLSVVPATPRLRKLTKVSGNEWFSAPVYRSAGAREPWMFLQMPLEGELSSQQCVRGGIRIFCT